DQLGDPVAQEHVVRAGPGDAAAGVQGGDRLAGGEDPPGVAVALGITDVAHHVPDERVRRGQPERGGVAQVELEDLVPLRLQFPGAPQHRAPDVVVDVEQPARLRHHTSYTFP